MFIRESCLVGEGIDDLDTDLAPATVKPGSCDGIADATVHQPAWTALIKSLIPGGIQLPWGGQRGVEFLTVLHGFLVGETVIVAGEEDLA